MWCSKCNYYFCWLCGGPGDGCGPYYCQNKAKREDDVHKDATSKLPDQVLLVLKFVEAEILFQNAIRHTLSSTGSSCKIIEVNLLQVLVWVRASLICESTPVRNSKATVKMHAIVRNLEMILHALSMKYRVKTNDAQSKVLSNTSDDELLKLLDLILYF